MQNITSSIARRPPTRVAIACVLAALIVGVVYTATRTTASAQAFSQRIQSAASPNVSQSELKSNVVGGRQAAALQATARDKALLAQVEAQVRALLSSGSTSVTLPSHLTSMPKDGLCFLANETGASPFRCDGSDGFDAYVDGNELKLLADGGHISAGYRLLDTSFGAIAPHEYAALAKRIYEQRAALGEQSAIWGLATWHAAVWSPGVEPNYTLAVAYEYATWVLNNGWGGDVFAPEFAGNLSRSECLDAVVIGAGIANSFGWVQRGGRTNLINGVSPLACAPHSFHSPLAWTLPVDAAFE